MQWDIFILYGRVKLRHMISGAWTVAQVCGPQNWYDQTIWLMNIQKELTAISRHADIDIPVPSINFKAYSFGSSLQKETRANADPNQNNTVLPRASFGAVDVSVGPSPDLHALKVEQLVHLLPLLGQFIRKIRVHLFTSWDKIKRALDFFVFDITQTVN